MNSWLFGLSILGALVAGYLAGYLAGFMGAIRVYRKELEKIQECLK